MNQYHFIHYLLYKKKKRSAQPHFHHVVTSEQDLLHPPPTPVRPVFLLPAVPEPALPNEFPEEVRAEIDEQQLKLVAKCDIKYGDVVATSTFHGNGRMLMINPHDFIVYHDEQHSSSTYPRRAPVGLALYAAHGFLDEINCSVMTVRLYVVFKYINEYTNLNEPFKELQTIDGAQVLAVKLVSCVTKIREGDILYVNWDAVRPPNNASTQPPIDFVFNPNRAAKTFVFSTHVGAFKERWQDAIKQCRDTLSLGLSESELKKHWTGSNTTPKKFRNGISSFKQSSLELFVRKLDQMFFSGELLKYCRGNRMPVRCSVDSGRVFELNHEIIADTVSPNVVAEVGSPHASVMEAYAPDEINANKITVYTKAFDASLPSKELPHTFDGYLVTSPFELLLHAIAHEMVHCYLNAFASKNKDHAVNMEDDHGFTFCKVSKNVLGHPAGGCSAGSWAAVYTETSELASVFDLNNHVQMYDLL